MSKLLFPTILLTLVITLGFMYKRYDTVKNTVPQLPKKAIDIHASDEILNAQQAIDGFLDRLRRQPNDQKTKVQLALAYIQQSRVTGNHAFYDDAALKLVADVLAKEPTNFDALCAQTTVLLSQHHFTEGLAAAQKLVATYPDAAFGYGSLCDAQVELGNYAAAIEAADKMVAMRPDLRSYSRVSYLREIHGDTEGAKQAMEMAVKSGVAGMEQTEWCRVLLGKLHETSNNVKKAEELYLMATAARPDYPFALAGLARLAVLRGDFVGAEELYQKANQGLAEPQFNDELADVYLIQNQRVKSENTLRLQIKMLGGSHAHADNSAQHDAAMPEHGHYSDKEVAEAYLKLNDTEHARFHADIEYKRRPNNIEINELMARVLYKSGDFTAALPFMEKALRTNAQKADLLWKASQVFEKNNQAKKAADFRAKALAANPNLKTEWL